MFFSIIIFCNVKIYTYITTSLQLYESSFTVHFDGLTKNLRDTALFTLARELGYQCVPTGSL